MSKQYIVLSVDTLPEYGEIYDTLVNFIEKCGGGKRAVKKIKGARVDLESEFLRNTMLEFLRIYKRLERHKKKIVKEAARENFPAQKISSIKKVEKL